jgi:hypothetical protein
MVEIEGRGLDYERYALDRLFRKLVRRLGIGSVVEIPARGEKAMPSLYSLAFAAAGCEVTLVNPVARSLTAWHELGLTATTREVDDLTRTGLPDGCADLVWSFAAPARHPDPAALLREMSRLSRGHVMYVGVNRFNPGFTSHRLAHRLFGVPWSHGDPSWMNPFEVRRLLAAMDLEVAELGVVDAPPYPDSLGIRDMRLHRMGIDLDELKWASRTVTWMKRGRAPLRLVLLSVLERLPLPWFIKLFYAHLFYVVATPDGARP